MSDKSPQRHITQATLFAYKIPFKSAMQFNHKQLLCREGLILQLNTGKGNKHFAEIAPLPGFSKESFADVKAELNKGLSVLLNSFSKAHSNYKSVQFALDSLLLKQRQNITEKNVRIDNIPLLQGDKNDIKQQYQNIGKPNLIKLKVARHSVESDIAVFNMLCQINPLLKIRCDANQAWSQQQATQFFSAVKKQQLDYIEEPTNSHQENLTLAEQHHIALGLDETLQQSDFSYQHHQSIKAFIIKPSLVGSRKKIDHLVSLAHENNIKISFSSSFETIIGLQAIQNLALYYSTQTAHQALDISLGVDTLKYFKSQLLIDTQKIEQDCQQLEVIWTSQ